MRTTPIALLAACGATLLAAAAPAGAATLVADKSCYVTESAMQLSGSGFAAQAPITVAGEQIALSGSAGPDGAFSATVKAPLLGTSRPAVKRFTVTATDASTNTSAAVDVNVANAVFSTSTGFKSPQAKRTWKFSGLFQNPGRPIYGHFRHRGRTYSNYRFGVPTGPCGTLTRKAPGIPGSSVPSGKWTVQVDFKRTYDPNATPRLTGSTTVFKTFRRR
jgi:hypothetical protein